MTSRVHGHASAAALASLLSSLAACSGSVSPVGGPASDAGAKSLEAAASGLPTGTCTFSLAGALTGALVGVGFAEMDGSGNLIVSCGSFSSASASADALKLNVGNGSYDGPGEYDIDSTMAHGAVTFTAASATYTAQSFTAGCVVDVTTAPPGNYAPSGSAVAGTFSCTGLAGFGASSPTLAVAGGMFNAPVR